MEPRAHHVLIGLFTLLAAAGAIAFALWLSNTREVAERYYTVVFHEAVRGLSRGSAVQYNGLRVGDITDLSLDPDDIRRVRARIRVDSRIPIHEDTRARLELTGITGLAVIALSGGTPGSPLLTAPDGQAPVIHATPSALSQLLSQGDDMMSNISGLLINARDFMSPENAKNLSATLENLSKFTAALQLDGGDLQTLIKSLNQAATEASRALAQATSLLEGADGLLAKQGGRAFDSAQRAMAALEQTARRLAQLVQENQGALSSGMQGLGDIGPTLQSLRDTLAVLRTTVRRLDEDPAGYLLGREQIQEYRP